MLDEKLLISRVKKNLKHFLIKASDKYAFFSQTTLSTENQIGALVGAALPLHENILFTHGKYVVLMKKAARLSCSEKIGCFLTHKKIRIHANWTLK